MNTELLIWAGLAFIFGTIVGSFLNVLGLRLLLEEDFVKKPSYCYHCEHKLAWYDLFPILSYVFLLGRCRYCKAALSFQYPAVELVTGLLFALTVWMFGLTVQSALLMWLMANFMVIMITDFREQYIFDINSIGLIPFGLAFSVVVGLSQGQGWNGVWPMLMQAGWAIAFSWIAFAVLNLFSRLLFKTDGFGEGDTRLLIGLGSYFGLNPVIIIFVVSFVLQILLTIPMMIVQWIQQKKFKVLGVFTLAFVMGIFPCALQQVVNLPVWAAISLAAVSAVIALFSAFKALRLSRADGSELTYVPFGPAICVAAGLYVYLILPNTLVH